MRLNSTPKHSRKYVTKEGYALASKVVMCGTYPPKQDDVPETESGYVRHIPPQAR